MRYWYKYRQKRNRPPTFLTSPSRCSVRSCSRAGWDDVLISRLFLELNRFPSLECCWRTRWRLMYALLTAEIHSTGNYFKAPAALRRLWRARWEWKIDGPRAHQLHCDDADENPSKGQRVEGNKAIASVFWNESPQPRQLYSIVLRQHFFGYFKSSKNAK